MRIGADCPKKGLLMLRIRYTYPCPLVSLGYGLCLLGELRYAIHRKILVTDENHFFGLRQVFWLTSLDV